MVRNLFEGSYLWGAIIKPIRVYIMWYYVTKYDRYKELPVKPREPPLNRGTDVKVNCTCLIAGANDRGKFCPVPMDWSLGWARKMFPTLGLHWAHCRFQARPNFCTPSSRRRPASLLHYLRRCLICDVIPASERLRGEILFLGFCNLWFSWLS